MTPFRPVLALMNPMIAAVRRLASTPSRLFTRLVGRLSVNRRRMLAGPLAVMGLGVLAFSVLTVTGGTAHGAAAAVSTNPADVAAGQALYTQHCQSCHGVDGVGGVNAAPELIDAGAAAADFYLSTGRMPLNVPTDEATRHHPFFDQQEISQLVAYVNALPLINHVTSTGPGIPTILPECPEAEQVATNPKGCVTLSQGQQNFLLDCAQCHHASGSGGMLSKGVVVPSLHQANVTQVGEAMRVGPKPMPVFGPGQLDEQQLSAIAGYVEYLHDPGRHGGLPIARFGPVAEGFVGIVAGLGLLLVVTRLIGTRG